MNNSLGHVTDGPGPDGPGWASHQVYVSHAEPFDSFYVREYPALVALAHVLTGSRTHAEDVAQEALLAAYRRWDEIGDMQWPEAWVRRVCANVATSVVRRRIVESRALLRLRGGLRSDVEPLDEDSSVFWSEVRRLPRRQAQCVALFYMYGCSVAETAQVLGCSPGSVKTHLARGRSTVAAHLDLHDDRGSTDVL